MSYLHFNCHYRRCLKFEESNDKSQLIFGATTSLNVKDAIYLPSLNMMLVLDFGSNLVLYSGLVKVRAAMFIQFRLCLHFNFCQS